MAVFVWGLVGILFFFVLMLGVGIWAGTKQKNHGQEEMMLAGRNIGLLVGVLTIVATWVGGSYINGTSEVMFTSGLAWCQVPIGYSLSLFLGALLFARPMREAKYFTILDPFQIKYGNRIGSLMYIPALLGDVFWVGSILDALGSSLMVILDVDKTLSVIVSTAFAAAYTMAGGFYSVSYTDVVQLVCIVFGLILSAPFAYQNDAVSASALAETNWLGHLDSEDIPMWIDFMLLLILGGIPCQSYFQRILSMKTTRAAQNLSIIATVGCILMAVPPAFIGVVAKATDWEKVEGFNRTVTSQEGDLILALVLRYLTPNWVAFFGLGAISAAVMSSADACILSSSSMFSRNLYKMLIRPSAGEREVAWVLRVSILVVSVLATAIALTVGSVYYLSIVCSDLVYVILFPQLLLVVHWSHGVNKYGCVSSFFVGFILRILGGEKGLGIPALIEYPRYDAKTGTQKFPFRTLSMLVALVVHMVISWLTRVLFERNLLSAERWDVLGEFKNREQENEQNIVKSKEATLAGIDNPATCTSMSNLC